MLPILYSFRRCPYAIRARMALHKAGIELEMREVVLRDKPRQLLELSSKATVPLLQPGDGSVLDESLDIMRWALLRNDPDGWLSEADPADARQLLERNDGQFKQALDRYKYAERFPQQGPPAHRADAEAALLDRIEPRLREQPFLGGAKPRFTDVALFPFVRQFAAVDADWFEQSPWSATRRWLQHWLASADFLAVMGKAAPWTPGQPPLVVRPARDNAASCAAND